MREPLPGQTQQENLAADRPRLHHQAKLLGKPARPGPGSEAIGCSPHVAGDSRHVVHPASPYNEFPHLG